MKVVISGLPFFGRKLAEDLRSINNFHTFEFYNTYESFWDKIKFFFALFTADVVLSMNGVTDKSGSLDWAILLKKKIWMQWQGTDVLTAIKRKKQGNITLKYIDKSYQSTDAEWLRDELESINIKCEINHFKWTNYKKLTDKFPAISAYSYMLEGKEAFYGWGRLEHLAINNPDIEFKIVGTSGKRLKHYKNIHFLGWVNKDIFEKIRNETPIFIRLPEHDGYSESVIDALAAGNEILWSINHPNCYYAIEKNDLFVFNEILSKLKNNGIKRNMDNIEFAYSNFSKEHNLKILIRNLERLNERKN